MSRNLDVVGTGGSGGAAELNYMYVSLPLSLSLSFYIYVCMYVCMYVYIYIYIDLYIFLVCIFHVMAPLSFDPGRPFTSAAMCLTWDPWDWGLARNRHPGSGGSGGVWTLARVDPWPRHICCQEQRTHLQQVPQMHPDASRWREYQLRWKCSCASTDTFILTAKVNERGLVRYTQPLPEDHSCNMQRLWHAWIKDRRRDTSVHS